MSKISLLLLKIFSKFEILLFITQTEVINLYIELTLRL